MKNIFTWKETRSLFTNKSLLIAMAAVLFIPILYTGIFLWAFWDPYDKLDHLPVAVVNQDKGTTFEGVTLNAGEELVNELKKGKDFDWKFVDAKTAKQGLEDRDYYLMIEIPSDFSEKATTLLDEHPTPATIKYIPNEGFNFLSAQIGKSAIEQIKNEVSNTLTTTYAKSIFQQIAKTGDSLQKASDGAKQLQDGSTQLHEGSVFMEENVKKLNEGVQTLNKGQQDAYKGSGDLKNGIASLSGGLDGFIAGNQQLKDGAGQAKAGSEQLKQGLDKSSEGAGQLKQTIPALIDGTTKAKDGSGALAQGVDKWSQSATVVSDGMKQLSQGIEQMGQQVGGLLATLPPEQQQAMKAELDKMVASSKQLAAGSEQLAVKSKDIQTGANGLHAGLTQVVDGEQKLQVGVNQLADAQQQLANGASKLTQGQTQLVTGLDTFGSKLQEAKNGSNQLIAGSEKLNNGLKQLTEGGAQIQDGTGKLVDGTHTFTDGLAKVKDGSTELATGLQEGANQAKEVKTNDDTYKMFADPAKIKESKFAPVPNYGTGFAPYFASLGLFVGALLISIVFPLRDTNLTPKNAFQLFMSKFMVLALVGIIQALIVDVILLKGLDLTVQSVPYFVLFSILTSIVFMVMVQFFVSAFGDAGRFIAILVLILQLTTSAGTFPLELIPDFLQGFNAWLPMTYTVSGFKSIISTGDYSFLWTNVQVLLVFAIVPIILTNVYFHVTFKKWLGKRQVQSKE